MAANHYLIVFFRRREIMFSSGIIQYRCHQMYPLVTMWESCQHSLVNRAQSLSTLQDNWMALNIANCTYKRTSVWTKQRVANCVRSGAIIFAEIDLKNTTQLQQFTTLVWRHNCIKRQFSEILAYYGRSVTFNVSLYALLIRGNYICVNHRQQRRGIRGNYICVNYRQHRRGKRVGVNWTSRDNGSKKNYQIKWKLAQNSNMQCMTFNKCNTLHFLYILHSIYSIFLQRNLGNCLLQFFALIFAVVNMFEEAVSLPPL